MACTYSPCKSALQCEPVTVMLFLLRGWETSFSVLLEINELRVQEVRQLGRGWRREKAGGRRRRKCTHWGSSSPLSSHWLDTRPLFTPHVALTPASQCHRRVSADALDEGCYSCVIGWGESRVISRLMLLYANIANEVTAEQYTSLLYRP